MLELYRYRGSWQLATTDALYSDSLNYRPLKAAFKKLGKQKLAAIKEVLVLGTGLASAVHLLHRRGLRPNYTLIEADETILRWAIELLPPNQSTTPLCEDAGAFMQKNSRKYDLLIIDIFESRHVPAFVTSDAFLKQCRTALNPGGIVIFNYITNLPEDELTAKAAITAAFSKYELISFQINRVFIATA